MKSNYEKKIEENRKNNIICNKCKLKKATIVHHIDGNHNNDEENNLMPVCMSCHQLFHKTRKIITNTEAWFREFTENQKVAVADINDMYKNQYNINRIEFIDTLDFLKAKYKEVYKMDEDDSFEAAKDLADFCVKNNKSVMIKNGKHSGFRSE